MSKKIHKEPDSYMPFEQLMKNGFLEFVTIKQKEVLRLKPPFILRFEPSVNQKIFNNLPHRVESGGVLSCRPILKGIERILNIERADFIKNVSRNPYNSYKPRRKDWYKTMSEIVFRNRLLPIEFHSHPISKRKPNKNFFEYLSQMGASTPDQLLSEPIIQFENYSIVVPQAILIKDTRSTSFFVGIYGGLIAPKDFEPMIVKLGTEKAIELGCTIYKFLRQYLSDPKKLEAAKIISVIAAILGIIFVKQTISFLGFLTAMGLIVVSRLMPMFESLGGKEFPYFGIAHLSRELRISIPHFEITDYSPKELQEIRFKESKLK